MPQRTSIVILDEPEVLRQDSPEPINTHPSTRALLSDVFGDEPPYEEQPEDTAHPITGGYFYTWAGDAMHQAAREELTVEAMPQPMRAYRAYNVGVRLSEELQRQQERRHAWDGYVGARVGVRWDGASDGVLRWVGVVQQYGTPRQLYAGVEWRVAPSTRGGCCAGGVLRRLLCRGGGGGRDAEHGPGAFHRGEVDGELLFTLTESAAVATCERVEDIVFLPPTSATPLPLVPDAINCSPPPRVESVLSAVFVCFRTPLLWLLPLLVVSNTCSVLGPMVLRWYLGFLTPGQGAASLTWANTVAAVGSVLLKFSLQLVSSATDIRYSQLTGKYGYAARSGLSACIAAKCLRISSKSLQRPELNVGRIVNLVANDVGMLVEAFSGLWIACTIPVTLVTVIYMLYDMLGSCAFIGVGFIVLSIPVQAYLTKLSDRCTQEFSRATDARLRVTNEFLSGIRTVKMLGTEHNFEEAINTARTVEIKALKRFQYVVVALSVANAVTPTITVSSVLVAYAKSGGAMSLQVVYPVLSLFLLLYMPFRTISTLLAMYARLKVAMGRIASLLTADDAEQRQTLEEMEEEPQTGERPAAAVFAEATVSSYRPVLLPTPAWRRDDGETHFELRVTTLLADVDLRIPRGQLTVVLGPTGSGKSTLLDALIGALAVTRGRVACGGGVAYVPQQPWIMNATLRDNVVFFGAADARAFERAVASSQLAADLALLADGAATEIGEKGINLSGGQKARVSLARAVYADRDVYVLDDPLSALDAHVGERVMRECVCGALAGKTRVLATHQVSAAAYADYVVLLEDGCVAFQGTYAAYRQYAEERQIRCEGEDVLEAGFAGETADELASAIRMSALRSRTPSSCQIDSRSRGSGPHVSKQPSDSRSAAVSGAERTGRHLANDYDDDEVGEIVRLETGLVTAPEGSAARVGEEERAVGPVKWAVYKRMIDAAGGMKALYQLAALFVVLEGVQQLPNVWLSLWSGEALQQMPESRIMNVFILCMMATVIVVPLRSFVVFSRMRDASTALHKDLTTSLVRATLTFYDVNPLGRITNRVSRDIGLIDSTLPSLLKSLMMLCMLVVAMMLLVVVSQPAMIVILVPCMYIYSRIFKFYCAAYREMQRHQNVSNSPVFSILHEVLSGRWTINTYGCNRDMIRQALTKLDAVFASTYMRAVGTSWLAIRVELLGNAVVSALALLGVASLHVTWLPMNVGILALCVSNASTLTSILSGFISVGASVEASMNCVERVLYYTDHAPAEDLGEGGGSAMVPSTAGGSAGSSAAAGSLELEHVDMRYRPGLPLVLRDVSFAVAPGQKVGVVGRTGSGKSTLLLALLRLVEVCGGRMRVCGRDARDYGVRELRQLFSMIPQDPLLFDGTVRSNVDPFGACGDAAVWAALRQVGMEERVRGEAGGLDGRVQEGGSNYSVGQRQLLCLARALLKRGSAFLLMDEATANVDPALDRQIQLTVQHTFRDYTVVTIAHRLHTVAAYDVVLVMDGGYLVESGSPLELVSRGDSVFSSLVRSMGKGAQQAFFKALNGGNDE